MSLGYIGYCKKTVEDDLTVCYSYSGGNWSLPTNDKSAELAYDGNFAIDKSVLRWEPAKPREQTEYITWTHVAIENNLAVIITECKNGFYMCGFNFDYIALRLLYHIFETLHNTGEFPEEAVFIQ